MRIRNWTYLLTAIMVVLLTPAAARAKAPLRAEINAIFTSQIRDMDGNAITFSTDPATLLYTAALGTPLLAPDGHQLTWGEWFQGGLSTASVTSAKCVNKGTHFTVEVFDLIPNALYTVWLFTVPTLTSPLALGRMPNALAHGGNHFIADENGSAVFNAIAPAGPLSIAGEIPHCLLDNPVFIVQIAYHSDGLLYGPVPGPVGITLDHINFRFRP